MAQNGDSEESKFRLRSYQEEMLEASLRENVIVKMDTGSGKTAIAIARAEAALQNCDHDKIVWVLAPTVVLCTQHSQTFGQRLPGYQLRLLIGSDGIDRWSDQATWDAALKNIRIVVSTYSVLNDALNNGFLPFEKLALLIFDEVHNCIGDNQGAQVMRKFYFEATQKPVILGLSASIIDQNYFEQIFDARVITPKKCRTELLHHANRPVLEYISFAENPFEPPQKLTLLERMKATYNRTTDPWFQNLTDEGRIDFLIQNRATLCEKELAALLQKTNHVFEQLGPSMADFFIESTVRVMLKKIDANGGLNADSTMTQAEALHLSTLLHFLVPPSSPKKQKLLADVEDDGVAHMEFSPKVHALLAFLEQEWSPTFTGLIFVQQRALAYALAHVLSKYPFRRAQIRVQGFVGTSRVADPAKRLIEQVLPQDHIGVLEKFRSAEREINLIVATEVLGEGVDVPQCHLVLCFDPPPRIISFVQKRGRARLKDSKYVLMFQKGVDSSKIQKWQKIEKELDEAFQKEERLWQMSRQLEERHDFDADTKVFRVASTGARLDHDNAVPKLHHLCQTLQSQGWVDSRPRFAYTEDAISNTVTAVVSLPLFFEPELRVTSSSQPWLTERVAKRDAAFEALVILYKNGLLNDHLLPLKEDKPEMEVVTKQKRSFCDVLPRINPWVEIARGIDWSSLWHPQQITISREDGQDPSAIELLVLMPIPLLLLPSFTLYWNNTTRYRVKGCPTESRRLSETPGVVNGLEQEVDMNADHENGNVQPLRAMTRRLLLSASGGRMQADLNDFPFLVTMIGDIVINTAKAKHGSDEIVTSEMLSAGQQLQGRGFGVVKHQDCRYLYRGMTRAHFNEEGFMEDPSGEAAIAVTTYPKRRDFLHPLHEAMSDAYTSRLIIPASECEFESLTYNASLASLFLPAILRRIELSLITQKVQTALISHLSSEALPLLQAAITSGEAREAENYERLEFLGDAYINFLTSLNLMVEHPLWPEGYLTEEKGKRVSNDTFCDAALRVGLDQYIVTKSFTGQKWVPPYIHQLVKDEDEETATSSIRYQSSKKRVADVVEATIAVAYLDGGHDSAIKLCGTYFPDNTWARPAQQTTHLLRTTSESNVHLEVLEQLVGRRFSQLSLLLEAMTSGAYKGGDRNARSYERLEFLGDAVLDYLVVERIYSFKGRAYPHHAMHSIKTATVNSWILGFVCMEHFIAEARENIVMETDSAYRSPKPRVKEGAVKKHIWQFIRPGARSEKDLKSLERFEQMHEEIRCAFETGGKYPWPLLCQFNPTKIFSDVIESILGAIYVDSHASNEACHVFLERIGLYRILDRLLSDNVACMHPKELLGISADRRRVSYVYGEEDKMVTCHVLIGGEKVGAVATGETKEIASTIAAESAVAVEQQGKTYDMVEKVWRAVVEHVDIVGITGEGDVVCAGEEAAVGADQDGSEENGNEDGDGVGVVGS